MQRFTYRSELLIPSHPLANFEIELYHQNEPRLNVAYSRNNLPKRKNRTFIINLDKIILIGIHWIALYVNGNNVTYFDSFDVEYISKEIKKFLRNKNFTKCIYRAQAYDSIMCRYFYIGLIDNVELLIMLELFMLNNKRLIDLTNSFFPNSLKKMIK